MFVLLLFDQVVQTCTFQAVLGWALESVMKRMIWEPFHLFCVNEDLALSPMP
jgi:hypothetical protein